MRPRQRLLVRRSAAIAIPAPAARKGPPMETLAFEERIRRRAYELYVHRGTAQHIPDGLCLRGR